MCFGCYEELGCPIEIDDQVRYLARLMSAMPFGGGVLHIIIDDWNIDDADLLRCWDRMLAMESDGDKTGESQIARTILCIMGPMTIEKRATALAIYDDYIGIDGTPTSVPVNLANVRLSQRISRSEAKSSLERKPVSVHLFECNPDQKRKTRIERMNH